jgi:hypothetical protein
LFSGCRTNSVTTTIVNLKNLFQNEDALESSQVEAEATGGKAGESRPNPVFCSIDIPHSIRDFGLVTVLRFGGNMSHN